MDDLAAADEEDRGEPELGEEADERAVERLDPRRHHRLLEDAADLALEAAALARLGGERLHDAHAGDVLLHLGGQLGEALLHLLERGARAPPVAGGDEHHDGHGCERDRRERRVHDEHRDRRQQDRQRGLQHEHEAVAEEEAHRLQVDRRARHQLAGLLVVEERELEVLEVRVHAAAQVALDAERDAPRDEPAERGEREPHDADDEHRRGKQLQLLLVAGADLVDRLAGEGRDRDGHRPSRRSRARRTARRCAGMAAGIPEVARTSSLQKV